MKTNIEKTQESLRNFKKYLNEARRSRTRSGRGSATLGEIEVKDLLTPGDTRVVDVEFSFSYWYTPATHNDPQEGDDEITYDDVKDIETNKSILPELKQKYGAQLDSVLSKFFDEYVYDYVKENHKEFDQSGFEGPDDTGERI